MTLCMAVACVHEDEPRIVLCNDWKEEVDGIGSSEMTDKQSWVADGWPCLNAGDGNRIEDLLRVYRSHLAKTPLDENNYVDELKAPAQLFKGQLAESYVQQMLGVSYDYFLRYGKRRFPEDFFREQISNISKIKLNASLIICGFIAGSPIGNIKSGLFPVICVVEDNDQHDDVVREEVHFASIGSGVYTASAALYNRGAHEEMLLMGAIYSVFEAHAWSEKVPGVGEGISIDVLEPGGVLRPLSDEGYDYCEFLWKKFGPKPVIEKRHKTLFESKDSYFDAP